MLVRLGTDRNKLELGTGEWKLRGTRRDWLSGRYLLNALSDRKMVATNRFSDVDLRIVTLLCAS